MSKLTKTQLKQNFKEYPKVINELAGIKIVPSKDLTKHFALDTFNLVDATTPVEIFKSIYLDPQNCSLELGISGKVSDVLVKDRLNRFTKRVYQLGSEQANYFDYDQALADKLHNKEVVALALQDEDDSIKLELLEPDSSLIDFDYIDDLYSRVLEQDYSDLSKEAYNKLAQDLVQEFSAYSSRAKKQLETLGATNSDDSRNALFSEDALNRVIAYNKLTLISSTL